MVQLVGGGEHGGPVWPLPSIHDAARILKGEVRRDGEGREVVRCPGEGHSKEDRSLAVWLDRDEPDGIGVFSFAGDDPLKAKDYVRAELGLPAWKPNGQGNGHQLNGHSKPKPRKPRGDGRDNDPVVAVYEYQALSGAPVQRINRTKSKQFYQQHPDGQGGWLWGKIPDQDKVPYRLGELVEAIALERTVYIVEGEKGVEALAKVGLTATCSPGGAGKWPAHFVQWFKGAQVIILPDRDEPGQRHADKVQANLEPVAEWVRVIHLQGLKPGQDAVDWLEDGGDPASIITMRPGPPARGLTAGQLWAMDFPPVKFAVPTYIAEGLTLLAGAPKRGKSWLSLDLCVAVANGGYTLGDQHCQAGPALYCALEDSPRRMKDRLKTVCQLHSGPPEGLTVWFGDDLPRLGAGCEEALEEWLKAHPGARMIVIDTLNYIRPERLRDEDPYSYDYRSALTLQRLALKHGVAIVLVHHTRKSAADDYLESISGTNGLTGGCDAVIVLERQGDGSTFFKGRGRDVEEFELAVQFDKSSCRWSVLGDAAEHQASDTRNTILKHIREAGWFLTPAEIGGQSGLPVNVIKKRLHQMVMAGDLVRHGHGKYGLPSAEIVTLRPEPDGD